MTAIWTNRVWQAHLAAVAALDQCASLQTIMGASSVASSLGMFSLWMRWHDLLLFVQSFIIALKRLPFGLFAHSGRLSDYTGGSFKCQAVIRPQKARHHLDDSAVGILH
jgi:hypothetical protein